MARIRSHEDLDVYQIAFEAARRVFDASQDFPEEEKELLTVQLWQSSRAVCTLIAEAWRKRRSAETFVASLSEAEALAGSTQSLLSIASDCAYLKQEEHQELQQKYDYVLGKLVRLISNPDPWIITQPASNE